MTDFLEDGKAYFSLLLCLNKVSLGKSNMSEAIGHFCAQFLASLWEVCECFVQNCCGCIKLQLVQIEVTQFFENRENEPAKADVVGYPPVLLGNSFPLAGSSPAEQPLLPDC